MEASVEQIFPNQQLPVRQPNTPQATLDNQSQKSSYEPTVWALFAGVIITTVGMALGAALIISGTPLGLPFLGCLTLVASGTITFIVSSIFLRYFAIDNNCCQKQISDCEKEGGKRQHPWETLQPQCIITNDPSATQIPSEWDRYWTSDNT